MHCIVSVLLCFDRLTGQYVSDKTTAHVMPSQYIKVGKAQMLIWTRWFLARCCGNLVLTWKKLIEWEIVKSRRVMSFLLESSMGWNVFYDIWKWIIYALLSELGSIFEEHGMNKAKNKVA